MLFIGFPRFKSFGIDWFATELFNRRMMERRVVGGGTVLRHLCLLAASDTLI
ncbi:GPI-anchored surface protein, putative [Bodo saltans]|uniref:GPI-anchored surface protein, putative n=1 Tax=Bodo saltans TaxID=75058 RepID=A0A0S4JQ16_BODSA|nr:GPI-anchored surface protein, putative [Bodo saltans]|eukprot:CUG92607.1 GPI-anchored surface protein, putative [Bodo saltans]